MTRARDLADIISGGFTEADIPALSASKITSGSFADARIPNLAASKITSGAFDAGRLTNAPSGGGHSRASVASSGNVTLNLSGDDNYFDAGTLTGSTSVTFGTPSSTNKRFIYTFIPSYDTSQSSVNDTDTWIIDGSYAFNNEDTGGESRLWSPDGKKFYMLSSSRDSIAQHNLTSPFDMSTATFHHQVHLDNQNAAQLGPVVQRSLAADVNTPEDMEFNNNGTKLYVLCRTSDDVKEFSMSTPYDISTLTYSNSDLSLGSQEANPFNMRLCNNGSILYISGSSGNGLDRYNLGTRYDVSTGSHDYFITTDNVLNTSNINTVISFLEFSDDGNTAFIGAASGEGNGIYTVSLSSAFAITNAATVSASKVFRFGFDSNTGPFPN